MEQIKFNQQVSAGGQPTREDLQKLQADGFKAVINLRTEGEQNQPIGPQEEGKLVRELGMEYVHLPVSMDAMNEAVISQFRERLSAVPKPAFVHCSTGKRSGACIMMVTAVEQGMSGEAALQRAEEMGFECDVPELKQLVKNYVDNSGTK